LRYLFSQLGQLSSCRRKCPVGSEPSAAGGRRSEASEWLWSKFRERPANRKFRAPQQDDLQAEKTPTFRSRLLVFALPVFTARATIVLPSQVSGGHLQAAAQLLSK